MLRVSSTQVLLAFQRILNDGIDKIVNDFQVFPVDLKCRMSEKLWDLR
jgi:hypothetical protein